MKYQQVNMSDPKELQAITVGDKIRINNWRAGATVARRTKDYLLLLGSEFGEKFMSVIELLPSEITHNDRTKGYFTAGGDFWLFGWAGWCSGEDCKVVMNEETMEAYLRSFETGITEFSRNAVAVLRMEVNKSNPKAEIEKQLGHGVKVVKEQ